MSKYTKVCSLKTCRNYKGTKENIKMFKVPTELEANSLWKKALKMSDDDILRGMICIEHFNHSEINQVTKRLEKGALPTILPESLLFSHSHFDNDVTIYESSRST